MEFELKMPKPVPVPPAKYILTLSLDEVQHLNNIAVALSTGGRIVLDDAFISLTPNSDLKSFLKLVGTHLRPHDTSLYDYSFDEEDTDF